MTLGDFLRRKAERPPADAAPPDVPVEFEDPPVERQQTKVRTVDAAKARRVPGARRRT